MDRQVSVGLSPALFVHGLGWLCSCAHPRAVQGKVPWIDRWVWNYLLLVCACFRLALLRCTSQGCLAVQGWCCCCFLSPGVFTGGWLGLEAAQLLLGQDGRWRSLGIQESCAVFTWPGSVSGLHWKMPWSHWFSHPIFRLIPTETLQVSVESISHIFGPGRIC